MVWISAGRSKNPSPRVKAREDRVPIRLEELCSSETVGVCRFDFFSRDENEARLVRRRPDSAIEGRLELLLDPAVVLDPVVLLVALPSLQDDARLLFCEIKLNLRMGSVIVSISGCAGDRVAAMVHFSVHLIVVDTSE